MFFHLCLIIWSRNFLPNLKMFCMQTYQHTHTQMKYTLIHCIWMAHAILFLVLGKLRGHCQACSQLYSVEVQTKITTEKQMQWPLKELRRSYFLYISKCYILKVLTLFLQAYNIKKILWVKVLYSSHSPSHLQKMGKVISFSLADIKVQLSFL